MTSRFCSFQWEERKAVFLDPKHFPNGMCKSIPHIYQKGIAPVQSDSLKHKHCLASNYFRIKFQHLTMATEKDAVLARKHFPESIPHHPWERSECPLVKMWETFPYVLFGWQEDAAVFTIKIHLLRVLVSLRRTGTIWSAKTYRVGKTHQKRKAKAIAKTQ